MFNFYEALETLKSVKVPEWKEIRTTTLIILAVIVIMGLYFVMIDGVIGQMYNNFYQMMKR